MQGRIAACLSAAVPPAPSLALVLLTAALMVFVAPAPSTGLGGGELLAQEGRPPENDRTREEGRVIYFDRCVYCHGEEGDGNGPAADFLDPRPRDFTVGMFKLRTTNSGELPTNGDLFRAISRGLPGTAMPRWELTLSEAQRWKVLYYVKTFTEEFSEEEYDPEKQVVSAANPVALSEESVAKGREVFERARCYECHGRGGRGDGQKSDTLEDGWGFKVRVRNLTRGWNLKGGTMPRDIFYRFSTGVNGTPMPSFKKSLTEEERWHLANYISTVASSRESEEVVLKARRIEGPLPENPEDEAWRQAQTLRVPLTGQVLAKPRWQNISVDLVEVQAIYNQEEIALRVVWDDPIRDVEHHEDLEVKTFENTYVKAFDEIPRKTGTFRDAIAVQFPVKLRDGARKPHFFRGDASNPVNLWMWKSDLQARGANPVGEYNAKGFRKPLTAQGEKDRQVRGGGDWKDGQWRVVMVRALKTEDVRRDIQFQEGRLMPMAFNAWDGSNGEHGLIMSLSAWSFIALETQAPASLYVFSALAVALVFLGEWWFVRLSRRRAGELAPDAERKKMKQRPRAEGNRKPGPRRGR